MGDIAGCRREHEEGLGYAQRTGSAEAEARALGGLADAAYAEGRMRSAFEFFSRCVTISREHGFGRIEVANRSMVGFSRLYLNEASEAREDGDAAIRAAIAVGQPRAELLGQTMGMFATLEQGDGAGVQGYLDRAQHLAVQLGARRFEAQCIEFEGRLLLDQAGRENAFRLLRESLELCRAVGAQFCGPMVASALALALDDPREGEHTLRRGKPCWRGVRSATTICGSIATPLKSCSNAGIETECCAMRRLSRPTAVASRSPVRPCSVAARGSSWDRVWNETAVQR